MLWPLFYTWHLKCIFCLLSSMPETRTFALNKRAILKAKLSLFLIIYDDKNVREEMQIQFHANFNFGTLRKRMGRFTSCCFAPEDRAPGTLFCWLRDWMGSRTSPEAAEDRIHSYSCQELFLQCLEIAFNIFTSVSQIRQFRNIVTHKSTLPEGSVDLLTDPC
jgi:hypothetical protein